jgi:DNA-binding transcriptional MerR regulator
MERYYTTREVAEITRSAESTVRHWERTGQGPKSIKVGRRRLYPESEVVKWLNPGQDGGTAPSG